MHVRHERERDADAIREVVHAAFLNHPMHAPGALPHEPALVEALRAAGALTLSLVAEDDDGRIVGHIAFSPVTVDGRDAGWYGVGPVAAHPSCQGRGIGSALVNQGLGELRGLGAGGAVLVGDPNYYRRFGFHPDPALTLEGVPPEYFLALPLGETRPSGAVCFHSAFAG
ncbi:MAG TPA: N-acetyltransferase [Candidatus Hydrogenedentes bacterium]|nr:N-acetyltransferase [Candidatus Hydrogenedentota bacterium]